VRKALLLKQLNERFDILIREGGTETRTLTAGAHCPNLFRLKKHHTSNRQVGFHGTPIGQPLPRFLDLTKFRVAAKHGVNACGGVPAALHEALLMPAKGRPTLIYAWALDRFGQAGHCLKASRVAQ
jgi:hypothetical protein